MPEMSMLSSGDTGSLPQPALGRAVAAWPSDPPEPLAAADASKPAEPPLPAGFPESGPATTTTSPRLPRTISRSAQAAASTPRAMQAKAILSWHPTSIIADAVDFIEPQRRRNPLLGYQKKS